MEGHFNSQWLFSLGDPELAGITKPTTIKGSILLTFYTKWHRQTFAVLQSQQQ